VSNAVLTLDASGNSNRAYLFNGSSSVITVSHDEGLSLTDSTNLTVSLLVRLERDSGYLLGKDNGAGAQNKWMLYYGSPPTGLGQGLYFHIQNTANTGGWYARVTNPVLNSNGWQHLTYTREGSVHRMFVNGALMSLETNSTPMPSGNGAPLTIGSAENGGWVKGSMDQIRIYNRTLSTAEISQLYQQEAGNLDTDGDGLTDAWERGYGRYQIVAGSFTATQAKADAAAKGGAMATFTTSSEWQFFLANYGSLVTSNLRIGLEASNTDPSGWAWVTGEAGSFRNWDSGQPNGGWGLGETTTVVYSAALNHVWHDFPDNWGLGNFNYLLEFGYPTDPLKADTDGDGFNDSIESHYASDPNNAAVTPNTIRPAGRLVAWGETNNNFLSVPTNQVVDVSARGTGAAVTAQGSLVAWGRNTAGETNQVPLGVTNGVQVAVGHAHCVALKGDGSVVSW
ncbi:MAG: hypothetical protein EBZ78_12550, partial [Verrucomicrobia bacterium]|nr:hypothetical protein [Verrucomicrobiota bacterium]